MKLRLWWGKIPYFAIGAVTIKVAPAAWYGLLCAGRFAVGVVYKESA